MREVVTGVLNVRVIEDYVRVIVRVSSLCCSCDANILSRGEGGGHLATPRAQFQYRTSLYVDTLFANRVKKNGQGLVYCNTETCPVFLTSPPQVARADRSLRRRPRTLTRTRAQTTQPRENCRAAGSPAASGLFVWCRCRCRKPLPRCRAAKPSTKVQQRNIVVP
jgi:hypothetical protein